MTSMLFRSFGCILNELPTWPFQQQTAADPRTPMAMSPGRYSSLRVFKIMALKVRDDWFERFMPCKISGIPVPTLQVECLQTIGVDKVFSLAPCSADF